MKDILFISIKIILSMDFIKNLTFELQWQIGQHLNLYFPLSLESAKAIINKTNYQKYINHAFKRDNVEQLKIVLAVISSFDHIRKYINILTAECSKVGALECLQYLTQQGYHKHQDATWLAARNGDLACLQYLTKNGYPKHGPATYYAAYNGHLACLQHLTEQGYDKDIQATWYATRNGHLACLQYLTEQGYYKNRYATSVAAQYGHLDCLQYLTLQGYPKCPSATWVAYEKGHTDCYQYCLDHAYDI